MMAKRGGGHGEGGGEGVGVKGSLENQRHNFAWVSILKSSSTKKFKWEWGGDGGGWLSDIYYFSNSMLGPEIITS